MREDWRKAQARKAAARAKRMAARAAKQIVNSRDEAKTTSAETQAEKFKGKSVKLVHGGLPGQGKGRK
jgi:hypothetical protein